jgi:hypothetical protein
MGKLAPQLGAESRITAVLGCDPFERLPYGPRTRPGAMTLGFRAILEMHNGLRLRRLLNQAVNIGRKESGWLTCDLNQSRKVLYYSLK